MIHAANLASILKIKHGFFTRDGGVSDGVFSSRNCGLASGDDIANVRENRAFSARDMGAHAEALCTLSQVHGREVVVVEAPFGETRPEADAMVTKHPNLMLGILTADCAPILLADPINLVIGAAHAGWKGALSGIASATVQAMVELGANRENIIAAIGPCIAQKSYDVDLDFPKPFIEKDPAFGVYFTPSTTAGKVRFSLRGFVQQDLREAGVAHIEALDDDTYSDEKQFFSYRRSTQRGETANGYGRQLSAIMLV